jgi:hypothetical protein
MKARAQRLSQDHTLIDSDQLKHLREYVRLRDLVDKAFVALTRIQYAEERKSNQ